MFRLIRRILIMLLLLIVGGVAYHFLSQPTYRRQILQKAAELREQVQGEKTYAWSGSAVVAEILKGDTVVVKTEAHPKVVARLAGIDAPELAANYREPGQPLAEKSRDFLAQFVKNKAVHMAIVGVDFAQRPLVLLTLDGTFINAKMAEVGLAESVEDQLKLLPVKMKHAILNAELRAQEGRVGIWGLTNYQRPAEYRIRHRKSGV